MKELLLKYFWFVIYKKVPYTGLKGYHCRECIEDCSFFKCPCKSNQKLIRR
jgi:hypothetical protein